MVLAPMARGGLSSDPKTRERQLQALADGRRIARERREKGLPTKRSEARQSSASDAGEGDRRGSGKVVRGSYSKEGDAGGRTRAKTQRRKPASTAGEGPQLNRVDRAYARLLGVDLAD